MTGKMRLVQNHDGTYDLLIEYGRFDTEFAMDFFSWGKITKSYESVSEFISKNAKNIKISSVRIMVAGMLIATIPLTTFLSAAAAGDDAIYTMAYLYGGTVQQQIEYVSRTNNTLGTVSPSYFDINADGSLKLNSVSKDLVDRMHADNIRVVPFLSNHWDREAGINALKNVDLLSTQIANYVSQYNLDGVNVDIENVTEQQKAQYTELVRLLRQKIPADKEVSVAVAANPKGWTTGWHGSYDYTALAQNSDYLMMMTYDEHYEGGTAGPVASIGFVEDSIKYALSKTGADKLVVGLPFFGRVWSVNDTSVMGKGVGIDTINSMIRDYNAVVTFDTASQSPKAEFEVKAGDKQYIVGGKALAPGKYVVWYENDQSFEAKLSLVRKYNLKGAGSWALGQEDAAIWNNFNTWLYGIPPSVEVTEIPAWVIAGTTSLNVRQAPESTGVILVTINGGTAVTITGDAVNGFYPIRLADGRTGYTSTSYITLEQPIVEKPQAQEPEVKQEKQAVEEEKTVAPQVVTKTTKAKVSVRENAASTGKNLGNIDKGTVVTVLGVSGNYTQISYNGLVGYVSTGDLS